MLHILFLLTSQVLIPTGLSSASPAPAEHEIRRGHDEGSVRLVIEGSVLDTDGAPASGAVVVSGAGGRAIVDSNGRFRLELRTPLGARETQVTAVGAQGTNLLASKRVELSSSTGTVSVGSMWLARGITCAPSWLPFGEAPCVWGRVHALAVFDDGSGPALYVGGNMYGAGGALAHRVVKWDGERWSAVGGGPVVFPSPQFETVYCLAVFDDGTGPALYAGGQFLLMGSVTAHRIAKWDGRDWSPVGPPTGTDFSIRALAVFDDGGGPALYAGGEFLHAGGVPASFVAKWDGSSWAPVGGGMNSTVWSLTVHDVGGGPVLYAGGDFTVAGGVPASYIAQWDGSSWSALGAGVNGNVFVLAVHDEGNGPALFAGGGFTTAGTVPASNIARWDGTTWSALGGGVDNLVYALTVFDDGAGAALHAAGIFTNAGGVPARGVARWNGSGWSALGVGMDTPVQALAAVDLGSGPMLYAGGNSDSAGGKAIMGIAAWDGSSWETLGSGPNLGIGSLAVFDDGSGPALFAAGFFTTIGGMSASEIAKWDGACWSPLGSGIVPFSTSVRGVWSMKVFDDGSGPALYVGSGFSSAGGLPLDGIARWNGASWSALGSGISGYVHALEVFDDGSGPALYVGGHFTSAGGVAAKNIARWNGTTWSALGSGVGGNHVNAEVLSLVRFDDGSGEALWAGGRFASVGGVTVENLAKWDGTSWSALGTPSFSFSFSKSVRALAVFDDGGGPALYAGGDFSDIGGVANTSRIAKWNGASWVGLGTGLGPTSTGSPSVSALRVFDDGSGQALYAGGFFESVGGVAASRIAKWNGSSWSALGGGVVLGGVSALLDHDDGNGPALYAGGGFISTSDSGDSFLARWGCADTTALAGGF